MKRLCLTIIIIFTSLCDKTYAQRLKTNDLIGKADSVIIAAVGDSLFRSGYALNSDSYYVYGKKYHSKKLQPGKKIKGSYKSASIFYDVCIEIHGYSFKNPYPVKVVFDSAAKPSIILKNKHNPFISDNEMYVKFARQKHHNLIEPEKAIEIARMSFKQEGVEPVKVKLGYDHELKTLAWQVENIEKDSTTAFFTTEYAIINASNGEIIGDEPIYNYIFGGLPGYCCAHYPFDPERNYNWVQFNMFFK